MCPNSSSGQQPNYPSYDSTAYKPGDYSNNTPINQPESSNNAPFNQNTNDSGWPELFAEKKIRNAFVSKVYSILSMQLTFTAVVIALCVKYSVKLHEFVKSPVGKTVSISICSIYVTLMFVLMCIKCARRVHPINIVLLTALTVCLSLIAGFVSSVHSPRVVLMVVVATTLITAQITMLAKSSKLDMTSCGQTLCLIFFGQFIFVPVIYGLSYLFKFDLNITDICIAMVSAFILSLYLMYYTQLIMGGRKREISPDDHILATILLYLTIIELFLKLLSITGKLSKD